MTDPDINASGTAGGRKGDVCNYVYAGTGAKLLSDSDASGTTLHYNFTNNGNRYLIQLIWKNSGIGYCSGGTGNRRYGGRTCRSFSA